MDSSVLFEGSLVLVTSRSHKAFKQSAFKSRRGVLRIGSLSLYRGKKLQVEVKLSGDSLLTPSEENVQQFDLTPTPGKRMYSFRSRTIADKTRWMEAIQDAIQDFRTAAQLSRTEILKEGLLHRRQGGLFGGWKKCHAVLRRTFSPGQELRDVLIYSKEGDETPLKTISIGSGAFVSREIFRGETNGKLCFGITPSGGLRKHAHVFRGEDEEEFQSWVTALLGALDPKDREVCEATMLVEQNRTRGTVRRKKPRRRSRLSRRKSSDPEEEEEEGDDTDVEEDPAAAGAAGGDKAESGAGEEKKKPRPVLRKQSAPAHMMGGPGPAFSYSVSQEMLRAKRFNSLRPADAASPRSSAPSPSPSGGFPRRLSSPQQPTRFVSRRPPVSGSPSSSSLSSTPVERGFLLSDTDEDDLPEGPPPPRTDEGIASSAWNPSPPPPSGSRYASNTLSLPPKEPPPSFRIPLMSVVSPLRVEEDLETPAGLPSPPDRPGFSPPPRREGGGGLRSRRGTIVKSPDKPLTHSVSASSLARIRSEDVELMKRSDYEIVVEEDEFFDVPTRRRFGTLVLDDDEMKEEEELELGEMSDPILTLRWRSQGRTHVSPLGEGAAVIGRDPACDIVISDDKACSSRHCIIADGILVDPLSTNGTWVDGVRIPHNTGQKLRDGSVIRIGSTHFFVEVGSSELDSDTEVEDDG